MALDARQQWPERSWEMRWYRQHAGELLRHESPDLVAFADEKVVDAANRRDARVRHRRAQLLGRAELVVLRRDDERAYWDRREGAWREAHVLRADADEGDGVGTASPLEVREDLERPEAVADEAEWKARRDRARVINRRGDVVGLVSAAAPLALARADAAEVEAQRVPPALRARARDRSHDRGPHRAAVRRQGVRDHHDRGGLDVGYAQRRLEPLVNASRFLAHTRSLGEPTPLGRCIGFRHAAARRAPRRARSRRRRRLPGCSDPGAATLNEPGCEFRRSERLRHPRGLADTELPHPRGDVRHARER